MSISENPHSGNHEQVNLFSTISHSGFGNRGSTPKALR